MLSKKKSEPQGPLFLCCHAIMIVTGVLGYDGCFGPLFCF